MSASPAATRRRARSRSSAPAPLGPGPLPADRRFLLAVVLAAAVPVLVLWLLVATQWPPLVRMDHAVTDVLYARMRTDHAFAHALNLYSELFGTWSMRVVSVGTALWLAWRREFSTAAWAMATVFCANAAGLVMKVTTGRERPDLPEPIAVGVGPSFPSGHSLMAATGMGILLLALLPLLRGALRHAAWTAAIGVALSTALSRPILAVHWVSDIVAGLALGVLIVAAVALAWTYLPDAARRWDRSARMD